MSLSGKRSKTLNSRWLITLSVLCGGSFEANGFQNQSPRFINGDFGAMLVLSYYAGIAIYSADATPLGIGSLSSINP